MLGTVADVDIRNLRVFVTIVNCGGFTQAASHLNVAGSTISMRMADLERRLGLRLCNRGRSGFWLTREGEQVYNATKELLDHLEGFRNMVIEECHDQV